MRIPALVVTFVLGCFVVAGKADDALAELRQVRDALMERNVEISWLKAEAQDRFLKRWRQIREKPDISLPGFKSGDFAIRKVPLAMTRWSEWPGHWLSIDQVLEDPANYQRTLQVQQSVGALDLARLPISPLEQLELHHDFLEMVELLGEQLKTEEEIGHGATPPRFLEKRTILTAFLALMDRLALSKSQLKQLPLFNVRAFARGKVDPDFRHAYLVGPNLLVHDVEAHFRTSGLIYVLVPDPNSSILDWLAGRISTPKKGDRGTLILAERMLAYAQGGSSTFQFPKTIRLEDIEGTGSFVFSSSYSTYRLDSEHLPSPHFRKLEDDTGGVPVADLPNVHNSWRTQLYISCVSCHAGAPRLKSNVLRPILPVATLPDDTAILAKRGRDPILTYARKIITPNRTAEPAN